MKVTERCAVQGEETIFICDFSPPRFADAAAIERAKSIDPDFICVAYNPGRAVRVDSAMLAHAIKTHTGRDVIFNFSTRDMNKLAIQSHLLGAQMLGLENVVVIKGDVFTAKDRALVKDVSDFTPSELVRAIESMNQGLDFRGSTLRAPTDLCIGGAIDLGRGTDKEAVLTHAKVEAGAQFFITQPVFSTEEISGFLETYHKLTGHSLAQPVFWGLQVLVKDGVIFSGVPESVRAKLEKGREGADIAQELLGEFQDFGISRVYLVPPILKGGARDYEAAQRVLEGARRS